MTKGNRLSRGSQAASGRPDARLDCMGLVPLLDRCEVVSVDEHGADLRTNTGDRRCFDRRPLPAAAISLWELSR